MQNPLLNLVVLNDGKIKQCLQYNSNFSHLLDHPLIDKNLELSAYCLKFFIHDKTNHEMVERMLL